MLEALPVVPCGRLTFQRNLYRMMPTAAVARRLFRGRNPAQAEGLVEVPVGPFDLTMPSSWLFSPIHPLVHSGLGHWAAELETMGDALRRVPATDDGLVLDLGGNIGFFALSMRSSTKLPIVSFEPNPFIFELNRLNLARNAARCPNIRVEMLGCSDAPMEATLHCGINSAIEAVDGPTIPFEECCSKPFPEMLALLRSGKVTSTIRCVRLDDHFPDQPVRFMKIDVEGFELHVLRGAARILSTYKPGLFIELHPKQLANMGLSVEEVVALLASHGYAMTFYSFYQAPARSLAGRAMRHISPPPPQRHATWEEARARSVPDSEQYHLVALPA